MALLACGIVAPVFYVVMNDVVAASLYPGDDRIARPVSELLMIAFWIGVWRAARNNRSLRITTGLMLGFAALGLLAFPFPMRTDEVLGANTIHTIIWGVITPLFMLAGIGVSAAAFGKAFRIYALLTLMVAQVSGLKPGEFVLTLGDAHLYLNHLEQAKTQIARSPRPFPRMRLNPAVKDLFAFDYADFTVESYDPHPAIKAPIAV